MVCACPHIPPPRPPNTKPPDAGRVRALPASRNPAPKGREDELRELALFI